MKKKSIVLLALLLCLISQSFSYANDIVELKGIPIRIGDATINQSASAYEYLLDWGNYVDYYSSSKSIVVTSYTRSYTKLDSIYVKATLQKYDTSQSRWINITSGTKTNINSSYVDYTFSYTLSPGKYRVYSIHKTVKGSIIESDTSTSDTIQVY